MLQNRLISLFLVFSLCLLPQVSEKEPHHYPSEGNIKYTHAVEVDFPLKFNFSLSAESNVDITDIRLHYIVEQESFAEITSEVYIDFVPDTDVDVQWTWDMRRTGGLPPGSRIEYWWTLKDATGNEIQSTPARVEFNDNRYTWQSLTEGMVTMYWYKGDESFIEEMMSATQQALVRLAEDTGAYLKEPIKIYIYASTNDLKGAMVFPQEWTGGAAFTQYGVIVIGISPSEVDWGKRALTHELTHLVIYQMTLNPYNYLPTWLNEGLSMYAEGALTSGFTSYLRRAITQNSLITVRSLSSPFSTHAEKAYLSYAQSYSLIEFLVTSYGQSKMLELLNTFSHGSSYDDALIRVYGFNMDGLDELWRDYVHQQFQDAGTAYFWLTGSHLHYLEKDELKVAATL